MGSGACWSPLARALEVEFDVIMAYSRGHGSSSAPAFGYSYDVLAGDVLQLIQGLGLQRPVLLGHSMGGMTAAVAAQRSAGTLRGVVLVDPRSSVPTCNNRYGRATSPISIAAHSRWPSPILSPTTAPGIRSGPQRSSNFR